MSTPTQQQVMDALATVNDPEIKRPITELGMVDSVEVADDGSVAVHVLLTVAGCPLKDTINRDVTAAVTGGRRRHLGRPEPRRDDRRAARRPQGDPAATAAPSARSRSPSPAR